MTRPHLDPEIMAFDTHFERVGKILADELATEFDECDAREIDRVVEALFTVPIDMVLYCPACGVQHIDEAEKFKPEGMCTCAGPDMCMTCESNREAYEEWLTQEPWSNPPHLSHECQYCKHVWRPADVPTNGVAAVKTKGKRDGDLREWMQRLARTPAPVVKPLDHSADIGKAVSAVRGLEREIARIETHRKALRHFDILRDLRNRVMEISIFRFRKTDVLAEIDSARTEIRRVDEGEIR